MTLIEQERPAVTKPRSNRGRLVAALCVAGAALCIGGGLVGAAVSQPGRAPVPQMCLNALAVADSIQQLSSDGFGITADMIRAAGYGQGARLEVLTAELDDVNKQTSTQVRLYKSARESCKLGLE